MAKTNKEQDEKFIKYWENSMQLGRMIYSLVNGVLVAIILFALVNLGYYLFTKTLFLGVNMDTFLSFLICYALGFLFYYVPVWNINSFKYNVILNKKKKRHNKK